MTKKPVVQGGVENYLGKQPQVVAPRKWQSSPDAPATELAYSFGDIGGGGAGGADTAASGEASGGARFSGRGPSETRSDFEMRKANQREILQKAEQQQAENLGYRERRNISDFRAKKGPFGIGSLFSSVLGLINPFLGMASRFITSIPGGIQTFKNSPTLVDFYKNITGGNTTIEEDDEGTLLDQVDPNLPFAKSYLQSLQQNTLVPTNQRTNVIGTNYPGANQLTGVNDDLMELEQGVEPGFSPLQAKDGGRIEYMNGGLTDLVDIYD